MTFHMHPKMRIGHLDMVFFECRIDFFIETVLGIQEIRAVDPDPQRVLDCTVSIVLQMDHRLRIRKNLEKYIEANSGFRTIYIQYELR